MPRKTEISKPRSTLARNIRQLRALRGISQAGLHRGYVGSIERSERNVSIDNIARLALALGVHISELPKEETA